MNLLGWIKSAVALVRTPASPREVAPPQHAPAAIDGYKEPQDASADTDENRPESRIDAAEPQTSIESVSEISIEAESRIVVEPVGALDQQEIDRRREIVRAFFNDYWSSVEDKPASFAERLDQAESYINERAATAGEAWRLCPATRKQLGLPPPRKR